MNSLTDRNVVREADGSVRVYRSGSDPLEYVYDRDADIFVPLPVILAETLGVYLAQLGDA